MSGIGLVVLDDTNDQDHKFYFIDGSGRDFLDALERAEALLESSRISHIVLVGALITCGTLYNTEKPSTTQAKDLKEAQGIVKAFMGDNFDFDDMGKWHKLKQADFNKAAKEEASDCYVLVGIPDWDNVDRYDK